MSIGVYIRVSSQSQKADSQRAEIQRWLEAHGHALDTVQWFEDRETGATLRRSGFIRLQEAIFAGTVKTVIVWKLDRIARSMRKGINILSGWCECGVRVVSVTQQIDLSGTVGHLVAGVLFAVAEIELEHVRERQAAEVALAKRRGVYKGRKSGTTKGDPQRARELRQRGMKLPEIAQAQGVDKRTVSRYLKGNPS
jgi:DNA invertase Pin-like site-specific DNA recombinase